MLTMGYVSHSLASRDLKASSFSDTMNAWLPYALAIGVLVPIGPWEMLLIFPTNDKIAEMTRGLERAGKEDFGDERDEEVERLLGSWASWHVGRIVAPLVATGIMAGSAVDGRFGGRC